jgi:hypothetical protein
MALRRRTVLKGLGASALSVSMPWVTRADRPDARRISYRENRTAGVRRPADGAGLTLYLKERNNTLAGRPVQLFTGDSAARPRSRAPRCRSWSSATTSRA